MSLAQPVGSAATAAATRALFARVSRKMQVVVPLNAAASDPRADGPGLYCVHSIAGAGGTDFLPLTRHLGASVRMFGIQAPPTRMEEPAFGASVPELAAVYAEAICMAQPAGAIALAGWSAGASVALEIAHSLRARGRETALLVAIDGAPEIPAGLRPWDPRYWAGVAGNLPGWFTDSRAMDPHFLQSALSRLAKSCLSRAGGFVRGRKPEVAPRLEGFISLDRYPTAQRQFMSRLYDAIMRYRPEIWDGPVTLYVARVGPALSLPQYLERFRRVAPRTDQVLLEGNHLTIMREPRVADLARDLERRILEAAAHQAGVG
jgi:thioesterase domain-containing protein